MACTRVGCLLLIALFVRVDAVLGQGWIWDARAIGMGTVSSTGTAATDFIETTDAGTVVVLPFGLLQVLGDWALYDSGSSEFDPVRATESALNPFHYIIGRGAGPSPDTLLASDIHAATLSRDLAKYRGAVPLSGRLSGVATSSIGRTFTIATTGSGQQHGVFVGAGPYLSMEAAGAADRALVEVFSTGSQLPVGQFSLAETAEGQAALALTAGYRVRFPWPGSGGVRAVRDGVYLGVNYNYLRGLMYEKDDLVMRLNTDSARLVAGSSNVGIGHWHSSDGTGFALDLGGGVVFDRWEVGFTASGILNRIDWHDVHLTTHALASLTSGNNGFIDSPTVIGEQRRELPVSYLGSLGYAAGPWSLAGGVGNGYAGPVIQAGAERRAGRIAWRGGGHYNLDHWNPSGGVGLAFTPRVRLDVAAYGTNANAERRRQLAIAASVCITHVGQ